MLGRYQKTVALNAPSDCLSHKNYAVDTMMARLVTDRGGTLLTLIEVISTLICTG